MHDLLDPEKLAEHTMLRRRATGVALASGFGAAIVVFWAIAYLSESELELPAAGSVGLGVLIATAVWWVLAPKKLEFDFAVPEEPDDAALAALSKGFVAPLSSEAEPVSTGSVSDEEIEAAAAEAHAKQLAAALRTVASIGATFGCFGLCFYALGIRAEVGLSAVVYSLVPSTMLGFFVYGRMGRASEPLPTSGDVFQFAATLAVAETIEVVRGGGLLSNLASRFGITLARTHEIRSGGGYLANAMSGEASWSARLLGVLPFIARSDFQVLELAREELIARGSWHLSLPLMPERLSVQDASSQALGSVLRPFGLLQYELHVPDEEPIRVRRSFFSSVFRALDAQGAELGALEVFRPSALRRWFFGPFAGERGVTARFGAGLSEPARRLLLVAAIQLDRSI